MSGKRLSRLEPPADIRQSYFFFWYSKNGKKHCLFSMDSDLEAFSRNPTRGSFAALPFQAAAFTNYANYVFLSYLHRLLSQYQIQQ